MTLCRLIAPEWLKAKNSSKPKVLEGLFSSAQIEQYNKEGYNVYYFPNHPKEYSKETTVDGTHIDTFEYVFVDYDVKEKKYAGKDEFLDVVLTSGLEPSNIVDSGNGIHIYWKVSDLDAMSYLRLQRRLIRLFNTDEATGSICQLMRLPGTFNTKLEKTRLLCLSLHSSDLSYTCEQLDKFLPQITLEDEKFCKQHYDRTYNLNREDVNISDVMPHKFGELLHSSNEAKELWAGNTDDRSKNDYRLGHLMFANDFTKDEAATVLASSAKALTRAPIHRVSYAQNIVDKIWTYELEPQTDLGLSESVESILKRSGDQIKGTPFRCNKLIDNTKHGFRLGQVIGLVGGSGIGKTSFALNLFRWFAQENPDYHHFFIPLEQPSNEIADRWQVMCGENTHLHKKVRVMSNYDQDGNFRHLSLDQIQAHIEAFQKETGNKIGCVVIDHIGALNKENNDEKQDLITICHSMKAFAVKTNTLLVMQSQSNREKAGIGDLELNKDAAYGTVFFESYCDYLITLWQPLKRVHNQEGCPTITAFKYCKIRHKKAKYDKIQEDVPYYLYFDSESELLRDLNELEKKSFEYFLPVATNKRKIDRKADLIKYQSVPSEGSNEAKTNYTQ